MDEVNSNKHIMRLYMLQNRLETRCTEQTTDKGAFILPDIFKAQHLCHIVFRLTTTACVTKLKLV